MFLAVFPFTGPWSPSVARGLDCRKAPHSHPHCPALYSQADGRISVGCLVLRPFISLLSFFVTIFLFLGAVS